MHTEARLNFSIVPEKELEPIFLEFFLEFFLKDTFYSNLTPQSEAQMFAGVETWKSQTSY